MRTRAMLGCGLLLLTLAGLARADTVHLKDGRTITGEAKWSADNKTLNIKRGSIVFTVKAHEVKRIVRSKRKPGAATAPKRKGTPKPARTAGDTARAAKSALRARALAWLKGRTPKKLGKLVKHPNPSRRVGASGQYSAKHVRPYKKKLPQALTINQGRAAKHWWRYFPKSWVKQNKHMRSSWERNLAQARTWRLQPVFLEKPEVLEVVFHRDRASVRFRAIPVEQVLCKAHYKNEHCPGRWLRESRHHTGSKNKYHPAYAFHKGDRVTRKPQQEFTSLWIREGDTFYLAPSDASRGDLLTKRLPEYAGSLSVAAWNSSGKAKGTLVADVGVVERVDHVPARKKEPARVEVSVRVAFTTLTIVLTHKVGAGLERGATAAFKARLTRVTYRNKRGRIRRVLDTGKGTVRLLE